MSLSDIDRSLLDRCLARKPRSWEDLVDRFLGLVIHVINHTAQSRSIRLAPEDCDDMAAEVFLAIIKNDFSVLRRFRGDSSLATYLTVVARRIVVRELLGRKSASSLGEMADNADKEALSQAHTFETRLDDREEVERLLEILNVSEAEVVRLYHLEGKSYREINERTGIPENSIGPTLTRAREKMRREGADSALN